MQLDKKHADYVRELRQKTGMSRSALALKLGLSVRTIQMVEIAHQRLGKAALSALEGMAKGTSPPTESASARHESSQPHGVSQTREIIRVMLRKECVEMGKAIAETAGCSLDDAMEFVVKNEIKKGAQQ